MRVTLLHNKSAGSENHARDELEESLRQAGHAVVDVVSDLNGLLASLARETCELVVVAGGDGTVSRVSCALAGRHLPLAILPLGTANNTARSLGVDGSVEAVIDSWSAGSFRDFDLATIHESDRLAPLSEAVGWGIFPKVIHKASELSDPDQREHTLERDRRLFMRVIERARPHYYEIDVDGTRLSGDYLLVEVVNIPYIGPQLQVSPDSNPSDGKLELVLAGESERDALLEIAERGCLSSGARLPTRKAEHVTVRSEVRRFHRDGALVEATHKPNVSVVAIEPASVRYLLGPSQLAASAAP
jgi:diacylglycerol kinase (ATP)